MSGKPTIDWYFDYVSPFAYLQSTRLDEITALADINYRPVLFAGLLRQWEHKGPVEIPGKKLLTYRYAHWLAGQMGVAYRTPDHHPFNPLNVLRLTLALGAERKTIDSIFKAIWADGHLPDTPDGWQAIVQRIGGCDTEKKLGDPAVKSALMENGERAIKAQVFGVPTFIANDQLFWGVDSTDMLIDYLRAPDMFDQQDMARLETITPSTRRRGGT